MASSCTNEEITVSDGIMTACHEIVRSTPLTFAEVKAKMAFLVFHVVTVGVFFGIQEIVRLNFRFDLSAQQIDFTIERKSFRGKCKLDHIVNYNTRRKNLMMKILP